MDTITQNKTTNVTTRHVTRAVHIGSPLCYILLTADSMETAAQQDLSSQGPQRRPREHPRGDPTLQNPAPGAETPGGR